MVAITGTKGKSTTTTLVYRSLKAHAPDTVLMGNMGIPFFEAVQHIGRRGWVVAELSSHQLEFVSISPRIGVFLNLFPEHLDHYVDYNAYGEAKYNILRYQQSTDWAFVSYGQPEVVELLRRHPLRSQVIPIGHPSGVHLAPDGVYLAFERLVHREAPRHLPGDHNLLNGGVAAAVARQLGVPEHIWQAVITDFEGLPHRLQYLGLRHGLHWYNDSISTIPQATLAALEALQPVETLLVGGMDRGVDVEPLIQGLLNRTDLRHLICLPTTGHALADTLSSAHLPFEVYRSADLAEAVACARIVTPPSGKVVLSPAAASYGVFRNFEHRGEVFNQLISQG
jgi:UDP-N-acetylmuramoylalanine--D-glutamate ligase